MPRAGVDRAAVVTAAATLADAEGLAQVTLARLAEQFGVRPPSLYNHVAGSDDLRRELVLLGLRELRADLTEAVLGRSGEAAIVALAGAYRAFARRRPGLYAAALWQAAPPDDQELVAAGDRLIAVVVAALSAYVLTGDEMIHTVRGLRSLLHGFVTLEVAGGFGLPLDLDESFQRLLQTYLIGLAALTEQ